MRKPLMLFRQTNGRDGKPGKRCSSLLVIALLCIVSLALATGGSIVVDSTNRVSGLYSEFRFEPSSASRANWVISWAERAVTPARAFTSAWDGVSQRWLPQVEHRTPAPENSSTGDLYLNWDPTPTRSRFVLVMINLEGPVSVWYRHSLDSQGTAWSTPVKIMAAVGDIEWDFPSIAVGTNGQMVVGASRLNLGLNDGYYSVVSNDGTTWSTPSPVVSLGGGVSRLVASGNVYHAFIDTTDLMGNATLYRYESTDGVNWSPIPSVVAQYLAPFFVSPNTYSDTCPNGNRPCPCAGAPRCGRIGYASDPDAVGSTGLGWVVAFQYKVQDKNAIAVCRETLTGCESFTHSTDLFLHGITTSPASDYWLTYHTFAGAPNRYLPLLQGIVYRTPTGNFLGAVINDCIAPKFWWLSPAGTYRCGSFPCFSAGDYMRPTSDTSARTLAPFIHQSLRQTDLSQSFVREPPQTPNRPQFLPQIESFPVGADLRSQGILTPAHLEQLQAVSSLPDVSTGFMLALRTR